MWLLIVVYCARVVRLTEWIFVFLVFGKLSWKEKALSVRVCACMSPNVSNVFISYAKDECADEA